MLEEKQRQFWNLNWIPHKTIDLDFHFSGLFFFFAGQSFKTAYFWKYRKCCLKIFHYIKNETKIENLDLQFCAEFIADSKSVFVFLLALIVFDFYAFEN